MAWPAEAYQLPLPCVRVDGGQCEIRAIRQVFHMMDNSRRTIPALFSAAYTLPPVEGGHLFPDSLPFWPVVELSLPSGLDQSLKLCESCLAYHVFSLSPSAAGPSKREGRLTRPIPFLDVPLFFGGSARGIWFLLLLRSVLQEDSRLPPHSSPVCRFDCRPVCFGC